jgi:hypothetical protein
MKLMLSAAVLGLALAVTTPQAQAHICTHGAHQNHCVLHQHAYWHHHHHHHWRYGEEGVIVGGPTFYVPDVDDPIHYANTLQWLMNREGDVPFTTYRVYPTNR